MAKQYQAKTKPMLNGIPNTFTKNSSICPNLVMHLLQRLFERYLKITNLTKKGYRNLKGRFKFF